MNIKIINIKNREIGAKIAHLCGKYREMFSSNLASLLKEKTMPAIKTIKINRRIALATVLLMVWFLEVLFI